MKYSLSIVFLLAVGTFSVTYSMEQELIADRYVEILKRILEKTELDSGGIDILSPNKTLCFSAYGNTGFIGNGKELKTLIGHTGTISSAVFSQNNQKLLTGSFDGTARLWDVETGKELHIFEHNNKVLYVEFSKDGNCLTLSTNNFYLWDAKTGDKILRQSHSTQINSSLNGSNNHTNTDNNLFFNHLKTVRVKDSALFLAVSKDRKEALLANRSTFFLEDLTEDSSKDKSIGATTSTASSADKNLIGNIKLKGAITCVALSSNSEYCLTGHMNNVACLWSTKDRKELAVFEGHKEAIYSVACSPDGNTILTGSGDHTVRLWDAKTGERLGVFEGHTEAIYSIAFSPDGNTILTGSGDHTVRLWDVKGRKKLAVFEGHKEAIYSVAFSPDGNTILTGSYDTTARLWDAKTGKELVVFKGHEKGVNSVAFIPNSSYILTCSFDNTARLWNVSTGKELQILSTTTKKVISAVCSEDGGLIITGSADKALAFWVTPKNLEEKAHKEDTDEKKTILEDSSQIDLCIIQ